MSVAKKRILYGVTALVVMVSVLSGILFSTVADAATDTGGGGGGPSLIEKMSLDEFNKAQIYASWLYRCFSISSYSINTSGFNNGEIGPKLASGTGSGAIARGTDSKACNDNIFMTEALNGVGMNLPSPAAGQQQYADFICQIGATRNEHNANDTAACRDITLKNDWTIPLSAGRNLKSYINSVMGGDLYATPTDLQKYNFYYSYVFLKQCDSKETTAAAESQGRSYVKVLNADGSFTDKFYVYNENNKINLPPGTGYTINGSNDLLCARLPEVIKGLATLKTTSQWTTYKAANPTASPPGTGTSTGNDGGGGPGSADTTKVCSGGPLGWMLCPILTLAKNISDKLTLMIEAELMVGPLTEDNVYTKSITPIWRLIVGFANLALVIAFLVVIFSQATSFGLSAYGIKKMLPRIIAAAILINLSFFLCAVALDIANVVGNSIRDIIQLGIGAIKVDGLESTNFGQIAAVIVPSLLGGAFAIKAGAIGYIFPLVIIAVMGILTIFVGLAIRKVLIVIMIIIAPLAFAAMILPGTEKLFKKWMKSYVGLLVMYPVIMAILYGCALVAKIIIAAGATG